MKKQIYFKLNLRYLLTGILLFLAVGHVFPATRTASVSGNWSNTATWGGLSVPGSGDNVVINSNKTVTVDGNYTCATLNFTTGTAGAAELNINSPNSLVVTGAVTIQRQGSGGKSNTINVNDGTFSCTSLALNGMTGGARTSILTISTGTVTVSGNITSGGTDSRIIFSGAGTLNAGGTFLSGTQGTFTCSTGTVNFNGAAQSIAPFSYTFYHVSLSGTGIKNITNATINGNLSLSGSASATTVAVMTIGGNLYVGDGTTLTLAGFAFTVNGSTTVGNANSGTLAISGTGTKKFTGNVFIDANASFSESAAAQLAFGGNLTVQPGGTLTENGAAIVGIAGNFTNNGIYTASTGNHTFSGAGKTFGGNISIPYVTLSGTYTNNANFTVTTTFAGGGTLTNGTTGILNINVPTASFTLSNLTATATGNTVNYGYYDNQSVKAINYYNLILSGSNTKTLSNPTTVSNNLTMSGTATATTSTGMTVGGNVALEVGSQLITGANFSIGGNLTVGNSCTFTIGAYNLTVTGNTIIGQGSTATLTFSSTTGTKIFNGNLLVNSGSTWNSSAANVSVTIGGSLNCVGTFYTGTTAVYTFTGSGKTISGTVSIPGLTIDGTVQNNGTLTISTALAGSGTFTNGASGVLNIQCGSVSLGNLNATVSGNIVNYNLNGPQNVKNTTYHNLYLSTSGAKTFQGVITINRELSIKTATVTLNGFTSSAVQLTLNDAGTVSGSWGGATSGATNINAAFTNGAGIVNVGTSSNATWTGSISNAWETGGNWASGVIPTATMNVIIPNVTNKPQINSAAYCRNITILASSSLTINGSNSLTVSGNWSNSATFTCNTSTVIFNGTAQTISNTASTTFYNFTAKGNGVKTINNVMVNNILSMEETATLSAAPTYGTAATLKYNTATDRTCGVEWITPFLGTGGVIIDNTGVIGWDAAKTFGSTSAKAGLTINSGATLRTYNYAFTLYGDFVNNGRIIVGNSVLTLTGTHNQNVGDFRTIFGSMAYSKTSGNVTMTGDIYAGTGGISFSGAGNTTIYLNGHTLSTSHSAVTVFNPASGATTINVGSGTLSCSSIALNGTSGNTEIIISTGTVTSTGDITGTSNTYSKITFTGQGILNVGGAFLATGSLTNGTGTLGTIAYDGITAQTGKVTTYYNLTLAGDEVKTFATSPTVNGTLSMEGTASVTVTTGVVTYGTGATLKYNTASAMTTSSEEWLTTFGASGGVLIANTGTITLNGNKTFSSGIPLTINSGATLNLSSNNLNLGGDLINNGTLSGTGDVTINGSGTQNIGSITTTGSVTLNKASGTMNFTGDVNGGTFVTQNAGGTYNLGSGTHTFTGAWTRTNGTVNANSCILKIGGSVGTNVGTFNYGTSTVNYNGSGAQNIATVNYYNLVLSNAGIKAFGGLRHIYNELSIESSASTNLSTTTSTAVTIRLGGNAQPNGTHGSTSSSATYQNNVFFASTTGMVSVSNCNPGLWIGSSSSDWNTPANWCNSTVPSSSTDVEIPSYAANMPAIGSAGNSCKNLIINSGATLTINSNYSLVVAGNWTNNGTFTANSSTVTLNGSSGQILGGTSASTFNNLTLNNSSGVTLGTNTTVNGTLTFTNGILTTTSFYNMTLGSSAAISGHNTARYINGNLIWNLSSGAQTKTFPIGDVAAYTPLTIQFTALTTGGSLKVITNSGDHPNNVLLNSSKSVNRYWTIIPTGLSGYTYNLDLNWVTGDVDAGANTSAFVVGQFSNSEWDLPEFSDPLSTSIHVANLTAFGDYQAGQYAPWVFPGWSTRKSHNINQTSGAGSNYSVRIVVHYGTGTDDQDHVYCNSTCQSDFGDIRFCTADSVIIGYWMEGKTDGDNAVFWVKIPGDLSEAGQNIYMYYGKQCTPATTTSNAANAFDGGDDGTNINEWIQVDEYNTGLTTIDGVQSYYANTKNSGGSGTGGEYYMYRPFPSMGPNTFTCFNVRTQTGNLGNFFFLCDTNGYGQFYRIDTRTTANCGFATTTNWNTWTAPSGSTYALANTWYRFGIKINADATQATLYKDIGYSLSPNPGTPIDGTNTYTISNNGIYMGLGGDAVGGGPLFTYWDNFITKRTLPSEPVQGSWGTQKTAHVWNNSTGNWQTGTAWNPTRSVTDRRDILQFVCGGTYNVTNVPDQTFSQLILANGSTVNLTSSGLSNTLTVTNKLSLTSSDVLNLGSSTILTGTLSTLINDGVIQTAVPTSLTATPIPSDRTWGGTVSYNAANGSQTVMTGTYNTLTMGNSSGTQTAAGNLTAATLNNISGGILNMGTNTLTASTINNTGSTIQFSGTSNGFAVSTGTIDYTGGTQDVATGTYYSLVTSGAGNKTALGAITATSLDNGGSSNSVVVLDMGNYSLTAPTIENTNSTIKFNGVSNGIAVPTGTIEYTATVGGQNVGAGTYYNLVLDNSSSSDPAAGNVIVNNSLTTTSGGIFDLGSNTLTGNLTSITNNGTILTTYTTGSPFASEKTWDGSGTVEYGNSGGNQTIAGGTYNCGLFIHNTSGTDIAGSAFTVNGPLTTSAGGTLNLGTFAMSGNPSSVNSLGTIRTSFTGKVPIPNDKTWGGTIIYEGTTGRQTLSRGTFNNMIFNNSDGGSLNNNIEIDGTFTLTDGTISLNGKTFSYGASGTLSYNGTGTQNAGMEFPSVNGPRNLSVTNSSVGGVIYNLDSRTLTGDFTLGTGSKFTINEGTALFVNGTTTTGSGITDLLIKSSASGTGCLCQQNSGVNATVQRYLSGKTLKPYPYHFISAPISNATLSNIWQTGDYNVYWYDETMVHGDLDKGWTRYTTGNMVPGRGYAPVSHYTNRTFEYGGSLNMPPVSIGVTRTPTDPIQYPWKYGLDPQGWNLLGNPFACALSANTFLSQNSTSLESYAVYSWDDQNGDTNRGGDFNTHNGTLGVAASNHKAETPNGRIAVGQGFFVKVNSSATSIIFNASQRVANNGPQFFVPDPSTISNFRFSFNGDSGLYNQSLISFFPEASDGFDFTFDALKLKGNPNIALYSLIDDKEYVIQCLSPVISPKSVRVGFDVAKAGIYSIKADEITNLQGIPVILEDKVLNIFTNLADKGEYTFSTSEGRFHDRFILHFNYVTGIDNEAKPWQHFNAYCNDGTIILNFGELQADDIHVMVSDISGKILYTKDFSGNDIKRVNLGNYSSGVYIVRISGNSFDFSQKVIVK